MRIIPKFQNGTSSDWYYGLNIWKQPTLPGLLPPRGGNYNNRALKDRLTGVNLDRAYERNNAYIKANKDIRLGDVSNYFNNGVDYGSLLEALNAYNADIDVLDNTFSSGNFNYDTSKWNATAHNNTFKKVYGSSALNGSELYKTGWDENQIGQGGSATWERRAIKYSTKFEDDLARDPKAAMDRVYETPYGLAYVDETGRLRPLSEELQEALGIIPREKYEGDPVVENIPKEEKVEKKSGVDADDINKTPINEKSNFLSSLLNSDLPYQLFSTGRVIADNAVNRAATDEYLEHLRPPLQSPWEAHRMVHGDFISKQNAEQLAARLRSTASRAFTSDADRLMAYLLEAVDKGNQALLNGQIRDANEFYRTKEVAAQLAIANIQNRTNTANTNRQLLSQYDEMRARIRKDQKIKNMQNWDQWAQFWENRALATRDAEWKRQKDLQEAFDYSVMNYGLDDSAYKAAYKKYEEAYLDSALISKYKAIIDDASATAEAKQIAKDKLDAFEAAEAEVKRQYKALQLAQIKTQGDYIGYDWSRAPLVSKKFKQYGIALKKGGTLPKLLDGGGLVHYTPLGGPEYWQRLAWLSSSSTGSSSSSSKSSSKASDTEKEEIKLLKSMVETLNSGDLLPSDMDMLAGGLKRFFSMLKYALDGYDIDSIYRGYIDVLSQVNKAKYSANTVKEAKAHLNTNKALDSFAITLDGREVYVGKVGTQLIGKVSPDLALKILNGEFPNYRILTNSDLLEVRSKLPSYAFSDDIITTAATSATSMESIAKYVKEFIGNLGTDKQSRDFFVRDFGKDAEQGLQVLSVLKSKGFSDAETAYISLALSGAGNINSLVESNIATESQLQQAKFGLLALAASLPLNMKTLLYLQGGGEQGGLQLLTNLVLKNTSSSFKFGINDVTPFNPDGTLGSSSKTGKGSSSSGDDKYKLSTTAQWISGMGEQTTFNINPESKGTVAWQVTGNTMPITDMSDKSMEGAFTLQDISGNSTLDLQHAYIGNTKITSLGLGKVLITDPNITRVALPVTVDELGGVKPYFERITLVNQINTELKNKNIPTDYVFDHVPTEQEKESIIRPINKVYQSKGLPPKYDENTGKLNFGNYKYFGLIKGFSPKSALDPNNEFDNDLLKELSGDLRNDFEARIKKIDSNFKFDNGWFSNEPVYEGIIFIPLRDNIFNSLAGKGSTYAPENPNAMLAIDAIQQKSDALKALGRPPHPIIKGNFNQ